MALEIAGTPLGQYQTNCYIIRVSAEAPEVVVVDPGAQGKELIAGLDSHGIVPVAILVTHFHFDHLGAVADLAERYGCPVSMCADEAHGLAERYGCPVSMCADEAHGLADPESVFPGAGIRPWQADVLLAGDETFEVAGIAFETVRVPGHSPAHIAFHADGELFSGDVLFAGSVGRTDLPGASWDVLERSIALLVDRFPPETRVHPGHGPATTLGQELATNPFLAGIRAERQARAART